ncbi:MAG TPA: response regulator [Stellaceae bacterium]|nr:response regulator [Stellaceae bacterium]
MSPVGRSILVVEDDERVRAIIEETLSEEGFAVTAVADGATALAVVERGDFALAVMEIGLPGAIDGIAVAQRARALRPALKCLFTARFPPGSVWDNPDSDDFIARPFDRRELLGCVFELLQRGGLERREGAAVRGARDWSGLPRTVAPAR